MAWIATLLLFVLLGAPAVRLLATAARERRTPELWCGLFFAGTASGFGLRIMGLAHHFTNPADGMVPNVIGHVALTIGVASLTVFTWRVFHPESGLAKGVATAILLLLAAVFVPALHQTLTTGETPAMLAAQNVVRALPLGWAFFESLRYWRVMRRRQEIGLADPVVTNRFLLWTLWTGGATAIPVIVLVVRLTVLGIYGLEGLENGDIAAIQPKLLATLRLLFLAVIPVVSTSLWLSFFPTKRYLDRVRRSAGAGGAAAA